MSSNDLTGQFLGKKYRSEITTQPKSNNLDYMINPTFRNINRLFALLIKIGNMILQESITSH